jgi:branched-chain amino acid transport system substrate-binding protein
MIGLERIQRGVPILVAVGTLVLAVGCGGGTPIAANTQTVNIAVVQALTGPGAADGQLAVQGAKLAADDINAQGGIKALGGAKVNLVIQDAGPTNESAASATQLALSKGNISAGTGAFLSSQTLAMVPIFTRSKIPWISGSVADSITDQGSAYIFRESAPVSAQNELTPQLLKDAATAVGHSMKRVALVGDNTAAEVGHMAGMSTSFPAVGADIVYQQTWTPPLADPLPIARAVKASNPDVVWSGATSLNDIVGLQRAFKAVGLQALIFGTGAPNVSDALLQAMGAEDAEAFLAVVPEAPVKAQAEIAGAYEKRFNMRFDSDAALAYNEVYILKSALENAKSTDPQKVRDALASLDLQGDVPAVWIAGEKIKFDDKGQNTGANVILAQWQKGVPVTVYPPSQAAGTIEWTG